MKKWCCKACEYVHSGTNSPMKCPTCGAGEDLFEYRTLKKEDYSKLRQTKKQTATNADIIIVGSGVSAFVAAIVAAKHGSSVIVLEPADNIGGGDTTGFSREEKLAVSKSLSDTDNALGIPSKDSYIREADEMLSFLNTESLLPEFEIAAHDPLGNAHPWQDFSESTVLDSVKEEPPESKRTLHYSLAHWATNNDIRVLLNHEIIDLALDEEENVVGIITRFNDKERIYLADGGIILTLRENPIKLVGNNAEDFVFEINNAKKISPQEEAFWGKEGVIGAAMTRAFKIAGKLILSSHEDLA